MQSQVSIRGCDQASIDLSNIDQLLDTTEGRRAAAGLSSYIAMYDPISLQQLNQKAEMLSRIDNKYIVDAECLMALLAELCDSFDVLDIDGKRLFSYSTRYFDDTDLRGYYDHHQRRRKRCKVRVREYCDAGIVFLEVKTNEKRSLTQKRRMNLKDMCSALDERCRAFVNRCFKESYDESFKKSLCPVITIDYQRITLVAKQGGERLTIDTNLVFRGNDNCCEVPSDTYIIETKSDRGNGIADKLLRAQHVQPTRRVSKYCMGMVLTRQALKFNGFLPALRKLGVALSY